jgi:hypothetical protein
VVGLARSWEISPNRSNAPLSNLVPSTSAKYFCKLRRTMRPRQSCQVLCVQFTSFYGKISQVPGGDRDEAAIGFLDGGHGVRWLSVGWQRRSRTQQRFNFGSNHRSCDGFSPCRNICAQDKKKAGQEYPDACVGSHSATSCRKCL